MELQIELLNIVKGFCETFELKKFTNKKNLSVKRYQINEHTIAKMSPIQKAIWPCMRIFLCEVKLKNFREHPRKMPEEQQIKQTLTMLGLVPKRSREAIMTCEHIFAL